MTVATIQRNPLSQAALTTAELMQLPVPNRICVITPEADGGIPLNGMVWHKVLGYTRRGSILLRREDDRLGESKGYQSTFVLGLESDKDMTFAPQFCANRVVCFQYANKEKLQQRHEQLLGRLKAAEPNIFWLHLPLGPTADQQFHLPALVALTADTGRGVTIASGFTEIEQVVGQVTDWFQKNNRYWLE